MSKDSKNISMNSAVMLVSFDQSTGIYFSFYRLDDARLCHSKIIQGLEILLRHVSII